MFEIDAPQVCLHERTQWKACILSLVITLMHTHACTLAHTQEDETSEIFRYNVANVHVCITIFTCFHTLSGLHTVIRINTWSHSHIPT